MQPKWFVLKLQPKLSRLGFVALENPFVAFFPRFQRFHYYNKKHRRNLVRFIHKGPVSVSVESKSIFNRSSYDRGPPSYRCHLRSTGRGQYLARRAAVRSAVTIKLYIGAHKRARKLAVKIKICRKTMSADELRPGLTLRGPPLHYLLRHLWQSTFTRQSTCIFTRPPYETPKPQKCNGEIKERFTAGIEFHRRMFNRKRIPNIWPDTKRIFTFVCTVGRKSFRTPYFILTRGACLEENFVISRLAAETLFNYEGIQLRVFFSR